MSRTCLLFAAMAGACVVAARSQQPLPADGTCHDDEEYRTIYESILGLGNETQPSSEHRHEAHSDPFVEHVARLARKLGVSARRVLDVGAGPGHISRGLAQAFPGARLTLVEPSPAFRASSAVRLEGLDYDMHPTTLDEFDCSRTKHDIVVLSHVLYHVAASQWGASLDKAYGCVEEGGLLVVAMMHDGGKVFDLLTAQWGNKPKSAAEVRAHLGARGQPYSTEVQAAYLEYRTGSLSRDFEAMYELVYFLAVEDALEPERYRALDVRQSKVLEKVLRDFVWSCFDEVHGGFGLTVPQEYVAVSRSPVA